MTVTQTRRDSSEQSSHRIPGIDWPRPRGGAFYWRGWLEAAIMVTGALNGPYVNSPIHILPSPPTLGRGISMAHLSQGGYCGDWHSIGCSGALSTGPALAAGLYLCDGSNEFRHVLGRHVSPFDQRSAVAAIVSRSGWKDHRQGIMPNFSGVSGAQEVAPSKGVKS